MFGSAVAEDRGNRQAATAIGAGSAQESILSRSLVPRRGRVAYASSKTAGVGVTPRLPSTAG